jgi:hypothetical protein
MLKFGVLSLVICLLKVHISFNQDIINVQGIMINHKEQHCLRTVSDSWHITTLNKAYPTCQSIKRVLHIWNFRV